MWNKEKSVLLTQFIVRACYFLLAAAMIALLVLFHSYGWILKDGIYKIGVCAVAMFCTIVPFGYIALISIDRLLMNIKKEIVFDVKNVKLLSTISRSCFGASLICLSSFISGCIFFQADRRNQILFAIICLAAILLLSIGAGFMGLVLRVIKNVFEHAIVIKDENDLTI